MMNDLRRPAHRNSFDLLRLLFSLAVLFTHSNPVTGLPDSDFLSKISHDTYYLVSIAVPGFFTISGFLVIQSLHQSPGVGNFLGRRFARIYPGLFVMLLLTVLLGWAVYSGSIRQYLHDRNVYTYFIKNILMLHKPLVFGFFSSNPVPAIINVSLWSIPYEVLFYLLLNVFFIIPRSKQFIAACLIYLVLLTNMVLDAQHLGFPHRTFSSITTYNVSRYGSFFFGGVVFGLIPNWPQRMHKVLLWITVPLLVLTFFIPLPFYCLCLVLPVVVLSLGLGKSPKWIEAIFSKTGDISYGVYIYGSPVQQALYYFLRVGYWPHVILSVITLCIIGYLSWNFIEKPALLFIRKLLQK